jgi:hypothetical protein
MYPIKLHYKEYKCGSNILKEYCFSILNKYLMHISSTNSITVMDEKYFISDINNK